jgi:hypothetical protein
MIRTQSSRKPARRARSPKLLGVVVALVSLSALAGPPALGAHRANRHHHRSHQHRTAPARVNYSGPGSQGETVTFALVGGQVQRFHVLLHESCSNPATPTFDGNVLGVRLPVNSNGDFSQTHSFTAEDGQMSALQITGHLSGKRTTGRVIATHLQYKTPTEAAPPIPGIEPGSPVPGDYCDANVSYVATAGAAPGSHPGRRPPR